MVVANKHRLPHNNYRGPVRGTFTLCLKTGGIFSRPNLINECVTLLKQSAEANHCRNIVYVFMPDHLHFVLDGVDDQADLWRAVVFFKQKSGYALARRGFPQAWQKGFYDYLHRQDDDLRKHLVYILENPVRKNLIDDWRNYPFMGSVHLSINEIVPNGP